MASRIAYGKTYAWALTDRLKYADVRAGGLPDQANKGAL